MREDVAVSDRVRVPVSEEVGVRVGVSEEVLVKEGLGDSVSEEVREEVLVGEGLADPDTEGLGDTGLYETEKTGSPCAFVAMSMGLVNWMSVDVLGETATPVDVKST